MSFGLVIISYSMKWQSIVLLFACWRALRSAFLKQSKKRSFQLEQALPLANTFTQALMQVRACFFYQNAWSFICHSYNWGSFVGTYGSNNWRSIQVPLSFVVSIPGLLLFHLTSGWKCKSTVQITNNCKSKICRVGGGNELLRNSRKGCHVLCYEAILW